MATMSLLADAGDEGVAALSWRAGLCISYMAYYIICCVLYYYIVVVVVVVVVIVVVVVVVVVIIIIIIIIIIDINNINDCQNN